MFSWFSWAAFSSRVLILFTGDFGHGYFDGLRLLSASALISSTGIVRYFLSMEFLLVRFSSESFSVFYLCLLCWLILLSFEADSCFSIPTAFLLGLKKLEELFSGEAFSSLASLFFFCGDFNGLPFYFFIGLFFELILFFCISMSLKKLSRISTLSISEVAAQILIGSWILYSSINLSKSWISIFEVSIGGANDFSGTLASLNENPLSSLSSFLIISLLKRCFSIPLTGELASTLELLFEGLLNCYPCKLRFPKIDIEFEYWRIFYFCKKIFFCF